MDKSVKVDLGKCPSSTVKVAEGESARGSNAFGGAADILLQLKRDPTPGHEDRRELRGVGRLSGTPAKLILELEDGHYVSRGSVGQVEHEAVRGHHLCLLASDKEGALSEKEILDAFPEGEGKRSTVKRVLGELQTEGSVIRERGVAAGSKTGFGYWLAEMTR